jgi:hypothetical protein
VDSKFLEGVKKVFGFGEENKELVDPYFIFSFAGKEVMYLVLALVLSDCVCVCVSKLSLSRALFFVFCFCLVIALCPQTPKHVRGWLVTFY